MSVFNEGDYSSGDGILTGVWGPCLWHFLHALSVNYPVKPTEEDKYDYYNFIYFMTKILPCKYCRDNVVKNLKKVPLTRAVLKTRENFARWMYDLHAQVNTMLGKKTKLSYKTVRDRYEGFRARCNLTKKQSKDPNIAAIKRMQSKSKKEKGCTNPLYGTKSRVLLDIVPCTVRRESLKVSSECQLKRRCSVRIA